uniref:Uncharacterized protein n=1 Tax=Rhizophora mucronata TaxID=61149 RepID=A0A2P2P4P9_RHIMU
MIKDPKAPTCWLQIRRPPVGVRVVGVEVSKR